MPSCYVSWLRVLVEVPLSAYIVRSCMRESGAIRRQFHRERRSCKTFSGAFVSTSTSTSDSAARHSGRTADQLRPVRIQTGFTRHAEGSVLMTMGDTQVLCTASVLDKVPPFLKGQGKGWVTAEYGMLPRSTHTRSDREAARGKQSGRTLEIQRLIGRSLRAVFDLEA